jgi:Fuc2NAc and GlcNAc transferase
MSNNNLLIFLFMVYLVSSIGTVYYKKLAIKFNILASLNSRTLHKEPTPRGGGIVFSVTFVFSLVLLGFLGIIKKDLVTIFGFGCTFALIVGYVDDVISISSLKKFLLQFGLVFWIMYCFDDAIFGQYKSLIDFTVWLVISLLLVWLINAYNFIDGIDGMAILGAILISSTLLLALLLTNSNSDSDLKILLLVLLASCSGFLFFNWPNASIFMGDAGSIFLGFCFSALIVYSVTLKEISILTWLVVFGYYLSDTSITTLIRMCLVKKWYGTHRSHAYQNLARIKNNHFLVTVGVLFYHLLWLLPLAILTVLKPNLGLIAVILAYLPSIIWTIKFGPLFSRE